MENTINRKEYRRNTYDYNERREKPKIEYNAKQILFLNKIINTMLILLSVLLLKFFNFDDKFIFIKDTFNSGIAYEELKEIVIKNFNNYNENIESEISENIEVTSGDIDITSGDDEYITAIEGINSLLDDSKKVKEIYEIISPLEGIITSKFGCRESDNKIVSSYHSGLDIAANTGTNILSAHNGKVIKAGESGSYGKCVMIESGDLVSLYAHCSSILVKEGQNIKMGENIAKVGMSGNATGPHLHFEIRYQGRFLNPEDII